MLAHVQTIIYSYTVLWPSCVYVDINNKIEYNVGAKLLSLLLCTVNPGSSALPHPYQITLLKIALAQLLHSELVLSCFA